LYYYDGHNNVIFWSLVTYINNIELLDRWDKCNTWHHRPKVKDKLLRQRGENLHE